MLPATRNPLKATEFFLAKEIQRLQAMLHFAFVYVSSEVMGEIFRTGVPKKRNMEKSRKQDKSATNKVGPRTTLPSSIPAPRQFGPILIVDVYRQ
jgi:hypothetical protein